MTTEIQYVPIGLDVPPTEPGAQDTFGIKPALKTIRRLEICGLTIYNPPGEVEILDVSLGDHHFLVNPVDAAAYNVDIPPEDRPQAETEEEAAPDAASQDRTMQFGRPRFCLFQPGIITHHRPLIVTMRSMGKPLRGTVYGIPVLDGDPLIQGAERWASDREFMRFVDLAFETRPANATLELMYYGWLGRARTGI